MSARHARQDYLNSTTRLERWGHVMYCFLANILIKALGCVWERFPDSAAGKKARAMAAYLVARG